MFHIEIKLHLERTMRLHSVFILPRLALHSKSSMCAWSCLSSFMLLLIRSGGETLLMSVATLTISTDCPRRQSMLVWDTKVIQEAANPQSVAVRHFSLVRNVKFSQIGRTLLFRLGVCCSLHYFTSLMPTIWSHIVRRLAWRSGQFVNYTICKYLKKWW